MDMDVTVGQNLSVRWNCRGRRLAAVKERGWKGENFQPLCAIIL